MLFCPYCGTKQVKPKVFCAYCGAEMDEDAFFCDNCGRKSFLVQQREEAEREEQNRLAQEAERKRLEEERKARGEADRKAQEEVEKKAKEEVKFLPKGIENGHEWIDLGLSVKWAVCNLGANSPEESGDFFAWGETSPKLSYQERNYKFCINSDSDRRHPFLRLLIGEKSFVPVFSKYNFEEVNGAVDNKNELELCDDAARNNWGGKWRMPTSSECHELENKCIWIWTTQGGMNGFKVTSRTTGNSIFLPAAGFQYDTRLISVGAEGSYWSSALDGVNPYYAHHMRLDSKGYYISYNDRYFGYSVRPVLE